jgi:hypothetical protein
MGAASYFSSFTGDEDTEANMLSFRRIEPQ